MTWRPAGDARAGERYAAPVGVWGAIGFAGAIGVATLAIGLLVDASSAAFAVSFYAVAAVVGATLGRGVRGRLAALVGGPLAAAVGAAILSAPANATRADRAMLAAPLVLGLLAVCAPRARPSAGDSVVAAALGGAAALAGAGLIHIIPELRAGVAPGAVLAGAFAIGALSSAAALPAGSAPDARLAAAGVAWLTGGVATSLALVSGHWTKETGTSLLALGVALLAPAALTRAAATPEERAAPCWQITLTWRETTLAVEHAWRRERLGLADVAQGEPDDTLVDRSGAPHTPHGWRQLPSRDEGTMRLERGALALTLERVDDVVAWRRRRPLRLSWRASVALVALGTLASRFAAGVDAHDDDDDARVRRAYLLLRASVDRELEDEEADGRTERGATRPRPPLVEERTEPPPPCEWTPPEDDTWCAFPTAPWREVPRLALDATAPDATEWERGDPPPRSTWLEELGLARTAPRAPPPCAARDCAGAARPARLSSVTGAEGDRGMISRALRAALPRLGACFADAGGRRGDTATWSLTFDVRGVLAARHATSLRASRAAERCMERAFDRVELPGGLPRATTVVAVVDLPR